jgi:hypothetical protein
MVSGPPCINSVFLQRLPTAGRLKIPAAFDPPDASGFFTKFIVKQQAVFVREINLLMNTF